MTKSIISKCLLLLLSLTLCSCSSDDRQEAGSIAQNASAIYTKRKLALKGDTLRVLGIGNSYTDDGMSHLDEFLYDSGININTVCTYMAAMQGASLKDWYCKIKENDTIKIARKAGKYTMPLTRGAIKDLIAQHWDCVVLQQCSSLSMTSGSFNPYLDLLLDTIKKCCSNTDVAICWQLTWSEPNKKSAANWEKICNVVKTQILNKDISIIIPTGTAIQNARCSSLNDAGQLTRDHHHLSYGKGRYIAAATWYQTLFAPICGKGLDSLDNIHPLSEGEQNEIVANNYSNCYDVNEANLKKCQECAIQADSHPFSITYIDNQQ